MEQNDEILLESYRRGDEPALETLVRRHADSLLGYLTRMTRNRAQAEDLFQETFLKVHSKAGSFQGRGRFKSWLYTIATRLALDSLRRTRREPAALPLDAAPEDARPLRDQIADPAPRPSEQAARADQAALVRAALDTLPPKQRAVVVLAYYEGLTYPDVAKSLHCTVGTVKTHMSRALRTLALRLPAAEGGVS